MKYLLITITSIYSAICFGQSADCNCESVLNPNYTKEIEVFKSPKGRIKVKVKHNLKNDTYLVFSIVKDSMGYFHIIIPETQQKPKISGWIKKEKYVVTYARNYGPKEKLFLFSKPNLKSKVLSTIIGYLDAPLTVLNCSHDWVFVEIQLKGKKYQGWLPKAKQCPNPYTNCS